MKWSPLTVYFSSPGHLAYAPTAVALHGVKSNFKPETIKPWTGLVWTDYGRFGYGPTISRALLSEHKSNGNANGMQCICPAQPRMYVDCKLYMDPVIVVQFYY